MPQDMSQLLMAMMGEQTAVAGQPMTDMLAQLGDTDDPRLRLVAAYLAQQTADQEEAIVVDTEWEDVTAEHRQAQAELLVEQSDLIHQLQDQMEMMADELHDLRRRNDRLAAALGACKWCWGEDEGCRHCHGRDSPGSYAPHPQLFHELVMPAVRRLKWDQARPRPHTAVAA